MKHLGDITKINGGEIEPVAGSGTTLRAAYELGRNSYGFEIDKTFYRAAQEKMLAPMKEVPPFEQLCLREVTNWQPLPLAPKGE